MHLLVILGLFLPLFGFLLLMLTSAVISRRSAGYIACATVLISFFCFAEYVYSNNSTMTSDDITLFSWIPIESINADFSIHIDHLALLMTLIITGVGALIHIYSIGYMDHEEDYARYFACLNFFIFAMLLLVLAGNLLLLFVGWEGVGLASYLLIGFWYQRPAAAQAATKAFVVNRIGDLGLLLGIILTCHLFGTTDISTINESAKQQFPVGAAIISLLTILYFIGAIGKSAQLPLYTWLPDAMEGPTPVSALIHAATMVTAGVYLVVRMHPIFVLSPDVLHLIGFVGAITALFASLCAVAQTDLKRVLAFSTVSQLGLMFLACSVGAFYAAMFHLTTHAFMKALLFLSAGNVVHMMHGTTDMTQMGGLYKNFPRTHILFLIGVLALSGIPPFAAFFSKDLILEEEFILGYRSLFYVALVTSLITAFYLARAYCLTFLGKTQNDNVYQVKEAPPVMIAPVTALAVLAMTGGFLGFAFGQMPILEGYLQQLGITQVEKEFGQGNLITPETWLSIAAGIVGLCTALIVYTFYRDRLKPFPEFLKSAFYINEFYSTAIVLPLRNFSEWIVNYAEPIFFEGSIRAISNSTDRAAHYLQRMQSGQIRSYVAWMSLGFVFLVVYLLT